MYTLFILVYLAVCAFAWDQMSTGLQVGAIGLFALLLVIAICHSIERLGRLRY